MLQFSSLVGRAMEAANHSKNSAMEAENHVQHGASSKSLMSRGNFFRKIGLVLLAVCFIFCGCGSDDDKKADEKVADDGKAAAQAICACYQTQEAAIIALDLDWNAQSTWTEDDFDALDQTDEAFGNCVDALIVIYENYFNEGNRIFFNALTTQLGSCELVFMEIDMILDFWSF